MKFAQDSFRGGDGVWGGDYVDLATPFGMRDKVSHVLCGALLFGMVHREWPAWVAWLCVLLGGAAVEALERERKARGLTFMADDPSWRDMVANLVGALLAFVLL